MTNSPASNAREAQQTQPLNEDWQLASSAPGSAATIEQLQAQNPQWRAAIVPGTVAQSLAIDFNTIGNYDAEDWWYRCTFAATNSAAGAQKILRLDGLATLAQVWLNDSLILDSRNMFVVQRCDVTQLLRDSNELVICFRALNTELVARKPRPRWKTALVSQQNLRWQRTTLLGRIPGWSPPITPVGPWRPIALEILPYVTIETLDLQTSARDQIGHIRIAARLLPNTAQAIDTATLHVGAHSFDLIIHHDAQHTTLGGEFSLPNIALWWPHTHGEPHLHACRIELTSGAELIALDCGRIGFKDIALNRNDGRVQFQINGTPVFCRGACWTINDFMSLTGTPAQLRTALQLAQHAGLNMLRIGGTMVYESDDFYSLCDELGILVWQDFMFANMDYPFSDAAFPSEIEREVTQQLNRLQKHPCIAVYCGGSEIEQQAAMLGLPKSEWSNEFFATTLPQLCAQAHRDIPYFPSTPCEGVLPFHIATGISHYYGVGAYQRPLDDVKHAAVKFASECLAFANVPDAETMALLLDGTTPAPHHPRWKARVPRDNSASWDFEDTRNHYLKVLFGVDAVELRRTDLDRYYALSRVVSGEVMKTVFAEWRKPNSVCGGGLIWFYKDLWPGAGWGIVDSTNRPKAVYWYLRRAWAKQMLSITDAGLDGLQLHCINETAASLHARIELEIYQYGKTKIADATTTLNIGARCAQTVSGDALLGHFYDTTYAYRFGPAKHDVVIARLVDADHGAVLSEDFYFPLGLALPQQDNAMISTAACFDNAGNVMVTLQSDVFLQSVAVPADGFTPDDNYFHLAPNREKRIYFTAANGGTAKFKAYLSALNYRDSLTLRVDRT